MWLQFDFKLIGAKRAQDIWEEASDDRVKKIDYPAGGIVSPSRYKERAEISAMEGRLLGIGAKCLNKFSVSFSRSGSVGR